MSSCWVVSACRARVRTERLAQSSPRSSSRSAPRMRVVAKLPKGIPVRQLRHHPHPRRPPRRAARPGLGQPIRTHPRPQGRNHPAATHRHPRPHPHPDRARRGPRRSPPTSSRPSATTSSAPSYCTTGLHRRHRRGPRPRTHPRPRRPDPAPRTDRLPAPRHQRPARPATPVITAYFFDERPMNDIADELGVTESRISQLRSEALVLLRDGLNNHLDPHSSPAPTGQRLRRPPPGGLLRPDRRPGQPERPAGAHHAARHPVQRVTRDPVPTEPGLFAL